MRGNEVHYVVLVCTWLGNICRLDIDIGKGRN